MKKIINFIYDAIKMIFPLLMIYYTIKGNFNVYQKAICFLIYVIWIFNFIFWRVYSFKKYFISPFNFIKVKKHHEIFYDIPFDLLTEKYHEILHNELTENFQIVYADKTKGEYLLNLNTSLLLWKQIMYIQMIPNKEETNVVFDCITINSINSYGKDQKRIEEVLEKFEEGLII
jgi:hypothetical protein